VSNGTAGYSGHDLPRREIALPELSAILIHPPAVSPPVTRSGTC